jgi:DNA-binding CsgD family transcriptional regulator
LATNVLEFHRYSATPAVGALIDRVTIADRADIAVAAAALGCAAQSLGLRIMVWHDLASLQPMTDAEGRPLNAAVLGWTAEELAPWDCRDGMLASPMLRACRVESEPFRITREGIRTRWNNRIVAQIGLDDFRDSAPGRAAIVVPVHMPFGQVGAAILVAADPQADDLAAPFARCVEALAAPVERFVRGYVMVTRDERYLPDDCQLTGREIECLNWIAHGKTDFEIGIILGCSHAGVRYHVTRACAKLGAVNRAQSVFHTYPL